ncbi:cytosine-purine permease [Cercophora newfieldiana]|uniref:Cytosine-purine permease n=1 Tax=Cercophora newfieldiana TaxID=92897 RepID=A0AA40CH89_9PEZI|nr:cytosine-purine permease [Cercophora newfieldiana]
MDHSRGLDPVDEEKTVGSGHGSNSPVPKAGTVVKVDDLDNNAPRPRGILAKMLHYEQVLDKKLGVESLSLERRTPEGRNPSFRSWSKQIMMFLMWISSCCNLCCFATGFIGYEFGLDLKSTLLITCFGNLLGCLLPGSCAIMGLKTGLRSVSMMRYSMGWYGAKLIALFNIIEQCGWTAVGAITGGLALSAVTDRAIGSALGVVILCVISLIISLVGVKGVLLYEKWSGIIYIAVFLVMWCQAGHVADFAKSHDFEGSNLTAGFLSVFSIMYASSASWGSIIADFYVDYPVNTPWWRVAGMTMVGIWLPTCFTMGIGAVAASALHSNAEWKAAYDDKGRGIGFLIEMMLHPRPLAKALLAILSISSLGMMSVSLYSIGLAIQQLGRPVARVPRFIYTILAFLVVGALGVIGAEKLIPYLVNFLSLLGYWATAYIVIVMLEHFVFRRGHEGFGMYNLEAWNDPSQLPVGYAGCAAFVLGLVGAIMGMSEAWHQGPLARLIGSSDVIDGKQAHYADLGNEVCFILSVLVFLPARWLELKAMKR